MLRTDTLRRVSTSVKIKWSGGGEEGAGRGGGGGRHKYQGEEEVITIKEVAIM